jgi:cytosine/adenosine deaminase-related metal-dependent hydrolase
MTDVTILRGRWVVTGAREDHEVVVDGAVAIEGDTIREVGPWQTMRTAHPEAAVLGSDRVAILPGLINAHHHSAGATATQHGVPDQLLEPWLLSLRRMRPSGVYLNTLLSAARLLGSGVTSVVDMHSRGGTAEAFAGGVGRALDAYVEAGIRVAFAPGIKNQSYLVSGAGEDERFLASLPEDVRADAEAEMPQPGEIDGEDYLGILDDLCRKFADHPKIDIWYGPPGPQWVSDDFFQRIAEAAARYDTGIQTHVGETFYEKLHGPRDYGKPTILHLHDLGVLGPRFSIAHGVWLTEPEIAVMAETGAALCHNPSSNLRLRAGVAPLNAVLAAGVTTALGMDSTTLNDDEDMFAELRLALRLHRSPMLGTPAPSPNRIFDMATVGGAMLLRKESRLGRIEPGYAADLLLVDLERIAWPWVAPEVDPRELIVMRAKAGDVTTVLIGGEVVYEDGRPTRFDVDTAARELAARLEAKHYPTAAATRADRLLPYLEAYYESWDVPDLDPYCPYNSRK